MKTKTKKRLALGAALVLMVAIALFSNAMLGNPISKLIVTNHAKSILAVQFAGTDYYVESVSYSFKDGNYRANIASPSSADSDFIIYFNGWGTYRGDDYTSRVEGRGNTANRVYFEYRALVERVIDSPAYPYEVDMGYGRLEFQREVSAEWPEDAVSQNELELDRIYNVAELGKTNGELVLYVNDSTVTAARATEILLETKRLCDEAGVTFYSIHFVLQYPHIDETQPRPKGSINLDLLYTDITPEGLTERIEQTVTE